TATFRAAHDGAFAQPAFSHHEPAPRRIAARLVCRSIRGCDARDRHDSGADRRPALSAGGVAGIRGTARYAGVLPGTAGQQRAQLMNVRVRETARLDLEPVVPVTVTNALREVSPDRELARLPLADHVPVLMQHQPGIL